VHRASVAPSLEGDVPGLLARHDRTLALATPDGRLILAEAQLPGGRPMAGEELLRGHGELVGASVAAPGSHGGAGATGSTRGPVAVAPE
jgi:hypothetical protein